MTKTEMLDVLRGKVLQESPEEIQARLNEIADELEQSERVVRCKDCRYWGDKDGFLIADDGKTFGRCTIHNYMIDGMHTGWCPKEDCFCSIGERKDEHFPEVRKKVDEVSE